MRRGRRMLLTLLALALPTAALANSVDFDTGTFLSGSITGTFKTSIIVTEVGTLAAITIDTGALIKLPQSDCTIGFTCYKFSGGSVTVSVGGSTVFTDSLEGGLTTKGNSVASISGALLPNSQVAAGTAVSTLDFRGNKVLTGSSDVSYSTGVRSTVPEPSTLVSLGIGLAGLAGMTRRKLWT